MSEDLFIAVNWWAHLLVLGIIILPFTRRIFHGFFDQGYLFSKAIGLFVTGFTVFLLSFLHILPFSTPTIWLVVGGLALYSLVYRKGANQLKLLWDEHRKTFLLEEGFFLAVFLFWAYVRSFQPDIYGLEKFMDFSFYSSILRTSYFPASDAWMAGLHINYYYYGHYLCAFLTKFSGTRPTQAYNLMLAQLFAMVVTFTFSIVANTVWLSTLRNRVSMLVAGLGSALLIGFGGSLHTVLFAGLFQVMKNLGIMDWMQDTFPWLGAMGWMDIIKKPFWYADTTRFIGYNPVTNDKTIHEIPSYSFIVSDLHGHLNDMPAVLTVIALLLVRVFAIRNEAKPARVGFPDCWTLLLGFILGLMLMTNTWDYPIYFTLTTVTLFFSHWQQYPTWKSRIGQTVAHLLNLILISLVIALPFLMHFVNFSKGTGLVHANTPIWQLVILWGWQFFIVFCLLVGFESLFHVFRKSEKGIPLGQSLKTFCRQLEPTDLLFMALSLTALMMIIAPEVIYIRDIYGMDYHRANTMFKFTFEAYIMLIVAMGYAVVRLKRIVGLRLKSWLQWLVVVPLFAFWLSPLCYVFFTFPNYYGALTPDRYKGLEGLNFLQRERPDDYAALLWLNDYEKGQPNILESNGDSYTMQSRFCTFTGLPTVLGWFGHEWLYRNGPEVPTARAAEVMAVYTGKDEAASRRILEKYQIKYIILGKFEHERYKNIVDANVLKLGKVVFNAPETKIIQVTGIPLS